MLQDWPFTLPEEKEKSCLEIDVQLHFCKFDEE